MGISYASRPTPARPPHHKQVARACRPARGRCLAVVSAAPRPARSRPPSSSSSTPRPTACGRRLRADRGRRGARRRRRAARPLRVARRRARAAVAAASSASPGSRRTMVDEAPAAELVAARAGRAARRPRARRPTTSSFDRRVLRQAFERAGLRVARPAVAVHGRAGAPLRAARAPAQAAPRWPTSLGIEVECRHRALADAETCARVFCALFPRLCAHAATIARGARRCCARRARGAARAGATDGGRARRAARAPTPRPTSAACPTTPASTCSATRRARSLYVGKSVALRTRARAHFAPSADARRGPRRPRPSTSRPRSSELGALLLENRLIRRLRAAGQRAPQAPGPLRLPALPPRHRVPGARGRAGAGAPGTRSASGRCAGARRRSSCSSSSTRCSRLRHCGRALPRRDVAVGLRADGALPVAVPGRPRPQRLPRAASTRRWRCSPAAGDGGAALLAHLDARDARRRRRPALRARRVARAPPRAAGRCCSSGSAACWRATHARAAARAAPRTRAAARFDPVLARRRARRRLGRRSAIRRRAGAHRAALRGAATGAAAHVPADEVAEARIVATWVARRDAAVLPLDPAPGRPSWPGSCARAPLADVLSATGPEAGRSPRRSGWHGCRASDCAACPHPRAARHGCRDARSARGGADPSAAAARIAARRARRGSAAGPPDRRPSARAAAGAGGAARAAAPAPRAAGSAARRSGRARRRRSAVGRNVARGDRRPWRSRSRR